MSDDRESISEDTSEKGSCAEEPDDDEDKDKEPDGTQSKHHSTRGSLLAPSEKLGVLGSVYFTEEGCVEASTSTSVSTFLSCRRTSLALASNSDTCSDDACLDHMLDVDDTSSALLRA
jgi:hypothetical protein